MRRFNVTGLCVPEKHYMVDISDKLEKIKEMVDYGDYFTINRARQYGKTTTLSLSEEMLKNEYIVASISFEGLGDESFASASSFCHAFMGLIRDSLGFVNVSDEYKDSWYDDSIVDFKGLNQHIAKMCRNNKIVLMIDEVDKASNNRTYLHFLGLLRDKYLGRAKKKDYTFHSVILAAVYDIKNIKLKMINEGAYIPAGIEEKIYNSPWNIAADFEVDMSFNPIEIAGMLNVYESDYNTGMNIPSIADEIHNFTSGYPYLTSRICKHIDEKLGKDWTLSGVHKAIQIVLSEANTLFDDMIKNLENNRELYDFLYELLFVGKEIAFNIDNPVINLGLTYGFLEKDEYKKTKISNRIFEIRIHNYFISKNSTSGEQITGVLQRDVVIGGRFNMELCLLKFAERYSEMFNERDAEFIEREGRLLFLSYLKPLINGQGFYHIESQFTDLRRMDIVVDFGREQFIIELKLWRGEDRHEKAYEQLHGYMAGKGVTIGFLLTFDFRKNVNKQPYAKWVEYQDIKIFDVVV